MSSVDEDTREINFELIYCARLYNTIIRTGFHKAQRAQKGDSLHRNWFDVYGADPYLEACRDHIPLDLVPFLEAIEVVVGPGGDPYPRDVFIHHLQAVPSPTHMFITHQGAIHDCLVLFPNNLTEPTRLGIVMEPGLLISYASNEECFSPDSDDRYWFSMLELLERLLRMIFVGKYRAVPFKEVDPANNPFCDGPNCWEVIPWNQYILNQTLEAYEGLVEAISKRLPASSLSSQCDGNQRATIATENTLSPAIKGFPRAFLLKASKPCFRYIAPGLTVHDPHNPPLPVRVNRETQYIDHPYREVFCYQAEHDPLVLFPSLLPGHQEEQIGLWIFPTWGWADVVKFVLPYDLNSYPAWDGTIHHNRRGGGGFQPTRATLWESPGDCPFFTDHGTRLFTILNRWRDLVTSGVWSIGADGVQGGMEFYRQAEEKEKAEWFCIRDVCFEVPDVDAPDDIVWDNGLDV